MYSSTCLTCSGVKSLISSRRTSSSTFPCLERSSDAGILSLLPGASAPLERVRQLTDRFQPSTEIRE
uniref:Uncharacterized protein n=1 Tax=Myoviridae sp. ctYGJ17 TaxID=2827692 RepID=A0A8S5TIB3_9CAUD|nr:MAG TPA: hypothetical protein [Myoviridae sp. ctYGJ17]DAI96822.1 MAG TPA: hypothetical protein [Caudoviricetes sp.]